MDFYNNILVIRGGGIGDFILTLPLITVLRQTFYTAKIEVMSHPRVANLIDKRYYADAVFPIDQYGLWQFYIKGDELPKRLITYFKQYDLIVSLKKDVDGVFTENLRHCGVKDVVSFPPLPPKDYKCHATEYLLKEICNSLQLNFDDIISQNINPGGTVESSIPLIPKIFITEEDIADAHGFLYAHNINSDKESIIAIHPGSGSQKKDWQIEKFIELTRLLNKQGIKVLWLVGPAEEERIQFLMSYNREEKCVYLNNLPLLKLASILSLCDGYVGNDSGITHLSAAVGTFTIAIFGPTDPKQWRPIGKDVTLIYKSLICSPCIPESEITSCSQECLAKISVEELINILLQKCLLKSNRR